MATRKELEVLQTNLRQWCQELGYRITEPELKAITKNSRNVEFWRLCQKLILPGDDIRTIRFKLAAYQRKQDYTKAKCDIALLQQTKQQLLARLSASKARSSQTVTSINTLKTKIKTDVNSKTQNFDKLSTSNMKHVLQRTVTQHCYRVQAPLKETGNTLQASTTHRIQGAISHGSTDLIMYDGTLATECTIAIKHVLAQINVYLENHISQLLQGPVSKSQLWQAVSVIQNKFSPSEILSTMTNIADDQCLSLNNSACSINFENELKELHFDVVNGNIINNTNVVDIDKTLEQHLKCLQNKVSREWIDMLDQKNKSTQLQKTINILKTELERNVQLLPWTGQEKSALGALLKFKIEQKEIYSKEETLMNELKRLSNEKEDALKDKIQTLKTHMSIKNFKKNSEEKQSVIKSLVVQTSSIETALITQKSSISKFVSEELIPLEGVIDEALQKIAAYPEVLSNIISSVPLDRLYLSPLGLCPVADLSIYQFENSINYQRLLVNTSLPLHLNSDSFVKKISEILTNTHVNGMTLSLMENINKFHDKNVPNSSEVFESLRRALSDHDTFTSENIVSRLSKHSGRCAASMKKVSSIKGLITAYTEQPAQHLASWVTVDGMTLKEVQEQWLVKTTMAPNVSNPINET